MKKIFFLAIIIILITISACNSGANSSESIVGSWKEYRADSSDDYGLGEYRFRSDGSGVFIVYGYTNTQKVPFLWEKTGSNSYKLNMNNSSSYLEINNGLLVESGSLYGTIVYKKQ